MSRWSLRTRAILDGHATTVIAALVALALLGGWLAYGAYVSPGTHTEQRVESSWRTTATFDHNATVTEENAVFPVGTTLDDRTTYFRSVAPTLDGTYRSGYADAERGDLSARANLTLVLRSVGGEEGEAQTEYWRVTRTLGTERVDSLSPGESLAVPFSVDVNELENRTARIRDDLGAQPGQVQATVRATVTYAGTVEGRQVDRTVEHSLPIGVDGSTYQVDDPGSLGERHEETRTVTVRDDPGAIAGVGGPVLFGLGAAGVAAVVAARRRGRLGLTGAEREWLAFRADRSDFEEWLVTMRLPEEADALPRAEAETLADLVDFAIDTDNAVAEHPETGTFAVVHDGYRYVYEPPSLPADAERDPDADGERSPESERDADAGDGEPEAPSGEPTATVE